ncbi:MAG TPA: ferredoxin oxidoreductase, partial [Nitrospira sp.]|nr:ferredoxin oxidoreductase [Nitrospira sp.]
SKAKIIGGPRVYGGQSMPVELIVDEVESGLTGKKSTNVAMSSIMGGVVNPDEVAHFMRSI